MNAVKLKEALATGVAVSSMNDEERKALIKQVLTYGIVMRSQNWLDNATFDIVANGLNDYLKEEFPNLRDKELDYVVRLGISGELGSSMETFVCGASFMRWVRAYYRHPERIAQIEAIRTEQIQKQNVEKETPDYDEANEKACNDSIHQLFEYYRRNNTIFGDERDDEGNVVKRGVFLPKWAGQIYLYYREKGKITEATDIEREVADLRAQHALSVKGVFVFGKYIYMKAEKCDWVNAFLLEQYFANVLKRQIEHDR